ESLVNTYVQTLFWQWECANCHRTTSFVPQKPDPPFACLGCHATQSMVKVERYTRSTIGHHIRALRGFFVWAKANRLIIRNPVSVRSPTLENRITHYPIDAMKPLHAYMAAPNADPMEAMALYLILFHAMTLWELRHVQMPDVVTTRKQRTSLAEAYYVVVPKRPQLGRLHIPGRLSRKIKFPQKAAWWLKPLLERFEQKRQQLVKGNNPYLFVTRQHFHRNEPIFWKIMEGIVRHASVHAMQADCKPNLLRKTAGVKYAARFGPSILRWLSWSARQGFAYEWMDKTLIQPETYQKT
ncbi:MAG TPA: hypothetical protein VH593_01220, partial [Ktedonobacteraceae bacterium]